MDKNIKISVIIPCYNQGEFLVSTLDSVLCQSYQLWECIIVNDGSSDGTEQIAKSYCKKDNRFIYLNKNNGGLSSARNAGIEIADGDYIQFLDSDDIIDSQKFEIQINCIKQENVDVFVSDYNLFIGNLNNQFENEFSIKPYLLTLDGFLYHWINLDFVIAIHAGLFKRDFLYKNKIRFNEQVNALEDWIFWCTLVNENAVFCHQPLKLAHYRVQSRSMTNDLSRMRIAFINAAFIVEDLLTGSKRLEFKNKISEILINLLSKTFVESELAQKANSTEYKLGLFLIYPFRKFKNVGVKIVLKFKKRFNF